MATFSDPDQLNLSRRIKVVVEGARETEVALSAPGRQSEVHRSNSKVEYAHTIQSG